MQCNLYNSCTLDIESLSLIKWQISLEGPLLMLLPNDTVWVIPSIFSVHQYLGTEVSSSSFHFL